MSVVHDFYSIWREGANDNALVLVPVFNADFKIVEWVKKDGP